MYNLHQDRIMDKIIENEFDIITIRQRFPISGVYVIVYNSKGKKIEEYWEK